MTNVNGNYKGGKNLVKYSRTRAFGIQAKAKVQKTAGKIAKSYKKYGKPTETLVRKTAGGALGAGKFLVKRGLFGFPGLAATAAYMGGKAIIKKGEKVARRPATKQWQKRDRFGKTRWYL